MAIQLDNNVITSHDDKLKNAAADLLCNLQKRVDELEVKNLSLRQRIYEVERDNTIMRKELKEMQIDYNQKIKEILPFIQRANIEAQNKARERLNSDYYKEVEVVNDKEEEPAAEPQPEIMDYFDGNDNVDIAAEIGIEADVYHN